MSHGISKDDLVMVVKPSTCCGNATAIGRVFTVAEISPKGIRCIHCGTRFPGPNVSHPDGYGYLPERVKRIPPIGVSESSERKIELHAA